MCSFGVASCARISSAAMPPPPKKTSDVTMYMIPMRLWSTVTSQLAIRPSFQETGYVGSALAATRARPLVDVRLRIVEQRRHLRLRPAVPDGRHVAAPVADDRRETGRLRQERVVRQVRAVAALALHPVARRADALELGAPELARRSRAREGAEVRVGRREHSCVHRLVVEAAELGALPVVRAGTVGLEPDVV